MIQITNAKTGGKAIIARDVCTAHPQWVHDQCGTASESELQQCLDALSVDMWYRDGKHLGPDTAGIEMFRDPDLTEDQWAAWDAQIIADLQRLGPAKVQQLLEGQS